MLLSERRELGDRIPPLGVAFSGDRHRATENTVQEGTESWKMVVARAATAAVLTYVTREAVKAAAPHVKQFLVSKFMKQEEVV